MKSLIYVDDMLGIGDQKTAEAAIRNLYEMERLKKFTINTDNLKSNYIIITTNKNIRNTELKEKLKKGCIKKIDKYKYLGVWINEKGNNSTHVDKLVEKLPRWINVLCKNIRSSDNACPNI